MAHRRFPVRSALVAAALVALGTGLSGCYVAPYGYAVPASFDQSWDAAGAALIDNGLTITQADRATGTQVGRRGNTEVVASVRSQPDGSVRVEFSARSASAVEPGLVDRVTASYQRRMGR
jgi:hypothetical protein